MPEMRWPGSLFPDAGSGLARRGAMPTLPPSSIPSEMRGRDRDSRMVARCEHRRGGEVVVGVPRFDPWLAYSSTHEHAIAIDNDRGLALP